MDLMKFTAVVAVELVIGTASIHLVNLSTATRRWVRPPLEGFLSGPTMSSPHVAKGHARGISSVPMRGVRLAGELLAPDVASDDVLRVSHGGGPEESCAEGFGDEYSAAGMMPADTRMYVEEYGFAIFGCDAPLEDLRDASFI